MSIGQTAAGIYGNFTVFQTAAFDILYIYNFEIFTGSTVQRGRVHHRAECRGDILELLKLGNFNGSRS